VRASVNRGVPTRAAPAASNRVGEADLRRIRIARSAGEIEKLRPLWEELYQNGDYTLFQTYEWNLEAARVFGEREVPFVVAVEDGHSCAIIPGAIRLRDHVFTLLGEELFDYRSVLSVGALGCMHAWDEVARLEVPLSVHAIREVDLYHWRGIQSKRFTGAPFLKAEQRFYAHPRLEQNLERLLAAGCRLESLSDDLRSPVGEMYRLKAAQDPSCLFRDDPRIELVQRMVMTCREGCELLRLMHNETLVSAMLIFRDRGWQRFYATYFDPRWAQYSPGITLVHYAVKRAHDAGYNFDFMTGEQPYKLRLAKGVEGLYRGFAEPEQIQKIARLTEGLRAA
jgi:CelD/BcsL family acetyltransferase involved in cellulose biosynthesis